MCDNTNIHDRVQASIATATREVDTALESVRAMRRAILAQMVDESADLRNKKVTADEVTRALKITRLEKLHQAHKTSLGLVCGECRDAYGNLVTWPCNSARILA